MARVKNQTLRRAARAATCVSLLLVSPGCARHASQLPDTLAPGLGQVEVGEAWRSADSSPDNIDSLAFWAERGWVVATAKSTHRLLVFDATNGDLLRSVGSEGQEPGRFRRPNGIAIVDSMALVVERDNRRVQVLRLPDFEPLGSFGEETLRQPYGIAAFQEQSGATQVYVSDNYGPDSVSPLPPGFFGQRIKHYRLSLEESGLHATHVRSFGATQGAGILHTVESLVADPDNGTVLVADEAEGARNLKLYTLAGDFTGVTVGNGLFVEEPEGIALYACGAGGFWIVTDQRDAATVFHLLERTTFRHLGSFSGRATRNTDGVALVHADDRSAGHASFFAVDDDAAVTAFDVGQVAQELELSSGCPL